MGVWAKIARVMAQVERVPKSGYNSFHKYKYATESDLTDAIRGLLAQEGLAFFSSVLEQQREGEFTKARMEFTVADAETGEVAKAVYWGEGQDKGDKGLYKAYTGATKYFLMKTFLIPTGDDPEGDGETGGYRSTTPSGEAIKPTEQTETERPTGKPAVEPDAPHPNKNKVTEALCKSIYIQASNTGLDHARVHAYARNMFQDPGINSLYDLGAEKQNYMKLLVKLTEDAAKTKAP